MNCTYVTGQPADNDAQYHAAKTTTICWSQRQFQFIKLNGELLSAPQHLFNIPFHEKAGFPSIPSLNADLYQTSI